MPRAVGTLLKAFQKRVSRPFQLKSQSAIDCVAFVAPPSREAKKMRTFQLGRRYIIGGYCRDMLLVGSLSNYDTASQGKSQRA